MAVSSLLVSFATTYEHRDGADRAAKHLPATSAPDLGSYLQIHCGLREFLYHEQEAPDNGKFAPLVNVVDHVGVDTL